MGSRAGFVVKRNGVAKAYGSRLAGSSTVSYLIRGPEKATKKFVDQGEMDELDDVLGGEDGAAVIDWDDKVVLWMMSNCRMPVEQRLCNRMIQAAFPGWTVRMAHDLFELSEHVGVDTSEYVQDEMPRSLEDYEKQLREEGDYNEEEIAELLKDAEQQRQVSDDDLWDPPEVPDPPTSLAELEGCGSWVTLQDDAGKQRDFFGFDLLSNRLHQGVTFLGALKDVPTSIDRIPPELVTEDGLFIDEPNQTIHLWHRPVDAVHQQLKTAWPGWSFQTIDGWSEQVRLSGRETAELACDERTLLGPVVADLAPYAIDGEEGPGLAGIASTARLGCGAFTAIIGIATAAVYFLTESTVMTVLLGVVFLACVYASYLVFVNTKKLIKALDLEESPKESNENMDRILAGLGYPSIAELKASGEMSEPEDEYEEDE